MFELMRSFLMGPPGSPASGNMPTNANIAQYVRILNDINQILMFDLERIGFFEHIELAVEFNDYIQDLNHFHSFFGPYTTAAINADDTYFNIIFSREREGREPMMPGIDGPTRTHGSFTYVHDFLTAQFRDIMTVAKEYRNPNLLRSEYLLTRTYYIRSVFNFAQTMHYVTQILNSDIPNKFFVPQRSYVAAAASFWHDIFFRVGENQEHPTGNSISNLVRYYLVEWLPQYVNLTL